MPHAALKLVDGVNVERTPTLNELAVSSCQLIRYRVDNRDVIVEKLGGWSKFYPGRMVAPVRSLWAWEDTEAQAHLGIGTQNIASTYTAQLGVVTNGVLSDITPRQSTDNVTPTAASTAGSSIVTLTDATIQNITQYDTVYIPTHLAIGGVVLFGMYPCNPDGHTAATTYTVQATDLLGNPLDAPSSSTSPVVASFTTVSGQAAVTVTLPAHGYSVGSTYPVLVPTLLGGVTFFGNYTVQTVGSSSTFTITAGNNASASTTGSINAGKVRFIYNFGVGAVAAGTGFGIGGFGRGGFGGSSSINPSLGVPISASDWTLDNWGGVGIFCASTPATVLATASTAGTGATGTVTFTPASYNVDVGESVTLAGVLPSGWNGTYVTTAGSAGSISFATALTSSQTQAGTATVNQTPFQPLYFWDSEAGQPVAQVIPQAPPYSAGAFVAMPQRQIVAWGTTFTGIPDPLLIRWCDVNNYAVWIGTPTNQAGEFRLTTGSRIVGAMQGPQQALFWTDIGLWSMQYIGGELVYGFNEIGSGCGLIAQKARASLNGEVYWMGPSQFYTLDGDGIRSLPCPVWDAVYQNLDTANTQLIRVAVNSRFNEIAWFYPTPTSGGEVAAYVKYNTALGLWDYGVLGRSAWIDQSVLGPPIGADPSALYLYQHETSTDADGSPLMANFITGYAAISEGDEMMMVDQAWPDFKYGTFAGAMSAQVQLTFYFADYPEQTPRAYGPFTCTSATKQIYPSGRGRLLAIGVASNDVGSFWRSGNLRYRAAAAGKY